MLSFLEPELVDVGVHLGIQAGYEALREAGARLARQPQSLRLKVARPRAHGRIVSGECPMLRTSTLREAMAVPLDVRGPRPSYRPVKQKFGYTPAVKTDLLLIPMGARWTDVRAAAVAADEAGLDGGWTCGHLRDPHRHPPSL